MISLKCRFPGVFAYYDLENLETGPRTQHLQNNLEDSDAGISWLMFCKYNLLLNYLVYFCHIHCVLNVTTAQESKWDRNYYLQFTDEEKKCIRMPIQPDLI